MVGMPETMVGELEYNGFKFPGAVQSRVEIQPVQDRSGRYTKYNRYMIFVECIVHSGLDHFIKDGNVNPDRGDVNVDAVFPNTLTSVDGDYPLSVNGFQELRNILTRQGKVLKFSGKGLGNDFEINTIQQDVMYGPVPTMLAWEPVGSNQAVRIVWTVEVHIADCLVITSVLGAPSEFGYDVQFSISPEGLTQRTITGYVEIVNQLAANGTPRTNVDRIRDRIFFQVPKAFRRVRNDWSINAARNRMEFVVVDQEYPTHYPYPKHIVDMNVKHNVRSSGTVHGEGWILTLSGNITVRSGAAKWMAWLAFLSVVKDKREDGDRFARHTRKAEDGSDPTSAGNKRSPLLTLEFSVTDDVFGRSVSFSISWLFFATFKSMFDAGGLWTGKLERANSWDKHNASMQEAWGPRGVQGVRQNVQGTDAIISLCNGNAISVTVAPNTFKKRSGNPRYDLFRARKPEPDESYILFKPKEELVEETEAVDMYPTGGSTGLTPQKFTPVLEGTNNLGVSTGSNEMYKPVVHVRGTHKRRVIFRGTAVRLCYKIPKPHLLEYAGSKNLVPIGQSRFEHYPLMRLGDGFVVYVAKWEQEYSLPDTPAANSPLVSVSPDKREFIG